MEKVEPLQKINNIFLSFMEMGNLKSVRAPQIFACIAANPGISIKDVSEELDISQTSISSTVAVLSDGTPNKPGYHLIQKTLNPKSRREVNLYLTKEGEKLAERIAFPPNRGNKSM